VPLYPAWPAQTNHLAPIVKESRMPEQTVTPGRIVTYVLSEADASAINDRHQATRNNAHAGDEYPALVVRTWGGTAANLQVFYDGDGQLWATSRNEGVGKGTWHWPARS
jgi:hypothetical protein